MNDFNNEYLETERLVIKKGNIDDYIKVYEYNFSKLQGVGGEVEYIKNDPEVVKGWYTPKANEDSKKDKGNNFDWIVYLKENEQPIGNIVADRETVVDNSIELSLNLHPSYWGKGYMPEALNRILDFLFEIGYNSIIYTYDEGNIKSQKLCEKLGFVLTLVREKDWVKDGVDIAAYENRMYKEKWLNKKLTETNYSKKGI